MKKFFILIIISFLFFQLKAQEMTIEFTTSSISGAKYSPKHIFAIWVTDNNGTYQKTLMVYANERKRELKKWNSQTGGDTADAITGATLRNHTSHTITWNLKNILNQPLPDGDYKLCMEITSSETAGPYREINFTVSSSNYQLTPTDGSNFKNITIDYKGSNTSVASINIEDEYMSLYPNPADGSNLNIELKTLQETPATIRIFTADGKMINQAVYNLSEGKNRIDISSLISDINKGNYLITAETNHYNIGKQLIITK